MGPEGDKRAKRAGPEPRGETTQFANLEEKQSQLDIAGMLDRVPEQLRAIGELREFYRALHERLSVGRFGVQKAPETRVESRMMHELLPVLNDIAVGLLKEIPADDKYNLAPSLRRFQESYAIWKGLVDAKQNLSEAAARERFRERLKTEGLSLFCISPTWEAAEKCYHAITPLLPVLKQCFSTPSAATLDTAPTVADLGMSVVLPGDAGHGTMVQNMRRAGLEFSHQVQDHNMRMHFTDFFELPGGRKGTLAKVEVTENGRVQKFLRVYYLSQSHCIFRLLPAVNKGLEHVAGYDKGGGGTVLAPRAIVQAKMATVLRANVMSGINRVSGEELVDRAARVNREWGDYTKYADDSRLYPKRSSVTCERLALKSDERGLLKHAWDTLTNDWPNPKTVDLRNPSQAPDYSRQVISFVLPHATLGDVQIYVYHSRDSALEYMLATDKTGNAAIVNISLRDTDTSIFGLPKVAIDGGVLCTGLLEYDSQTPLEYRGKRVGEYYVRTDGFTSQLPQIQRWHRETS